MGVLVPVSVATPSCHFVRLWGRLGAGFAATGIGFDGRFMDFHLEAIDEQR